MKVRKPTDAPKLAKHEIYALKALATGEANEEQQIKAFNIIIEKICKTKDSPYYGSDRDTTFAIGMGHVGRSMIAIVTRSSEEPTNE